MKYTVEHLVDGKRTISETAQWLEQKLEQEGMVFATEHGVISGGYAIPRIQEIYSCLNPLSGVNYCKNETEYIFIKFLNIEQCKVLCKGDFASSVKEGS